MKKGFTLVELMIVIAIFGIIAAIAFPVIFGSGSTQVGGATMSYGVNGVVEERCIGGYKFVVGNKGQPTQILDQLGKGVPCN